MLFTAANENMLQMERRTSLNIKTRAVPLPQLPASGTQPAAGDVRTRYAPWQQPAYKCALPRPTE